MFRSSILPLSVLAALGHVSATRGEPRTCLEWNGLQFLDIPGGEFEMGANTIAGKEIGFKDERPHHKVFVKPFCIMRTNLTEELALKLRKQTGEKLKAEDANEPNMMTWATARRFAESLGRLLKKTIRLPTEAEWEFAARGGLENKMFPWGNIDDNFEGKLVKDIVLKTRQDCKLSSIEPELKKKTLRKCLPAHMSNEEEATPINEFACIAKMLNNNVPSNIPNGYGLENLVNNEWEWTSSKYMPYPYNSNDGRESAIRGKLKTEYRVLRGGGNANTETCQGYTSLRGFGEVGREYQSSYKVRFVVEK